MHTPLDRREFLRLAGLGGVVFASGLGAQGCASGGRAQGKPDDDFYFVQLSDTHWGYQGAANLDAHGTLARAVAAVNALSQPPDFIVFTGDLTHLTLDTGERRARMHGFREIARQLKVQDVRYLPGEHDASADHGEVYREFFGVSHFSFDHKGLHFVALDNVSDSKGIIGREQLDWMQADLAAQRRDTPIVVLTHRPLFDLVPQWGWATGDAASAIEILQPFSNVTVFYGHIHQEHHHMTGAIAHHAARSLIFPLPPPGSPDHKPIAWDASRPYRGIGWREVAAGRGRAQAVLEERNV